MRFFFKVQVVQTQCRHPQGWVPQGSASAVSMWTGITWAQSVIRHIQISGARQGLKLCVLTSAGEDNGAGPCILCRSRLSSASIFSRPSRCSWVSHLLGVTVTNPFEDA